MKKYSFWIVTVTIVFAAVLLLIFHADIKPIDKLIHPPSNSIGESSAKAALEDSVGKGIILRTPNNKKSMDSIFLADIDGDKRKETVLFYSVRGTLDAVNFAVLEKENGEWKKSADVSTAYSDVEKVVFADVNDDGKDEIVVGLSTYNSDITRKLFVYSFDRKNTALKSNILFDMSYSEFLLCDVNADGQDDIFAISSDNLGGFSKNTAYFISRSGSGVEIKDKIEIDASISSVANVCSDYEKKDKQTRFFVDGYTSDGFMATDIVLCGKRSNKFEENMRSGIVSASKRDAKIFCCDADDDGKIEVPSVSDESRVGASVHIINWLKISSGTIKSAGKTIENQSMGYFLFLPDELESIASVKSNRDSGKVSIYLGDSDSSNEKLMFAVYAVNNTEKEKIPASFLFLKSKRQYDYYYRIFSEGEKVGISKSDISNMISFKAEGCLKKGLNV